MLDFCSAALLEPPIPCCGSPARDARGRSGRDPDPAAPGLLRAATRSTRNRSRSNPADRLDVGSPAPHFGRGDRARDVLAGGLWPCLFDANQLEHSLLNLAINALYAMASGGPDNRRTSNTLRDSPTPPDRGAGPGQYLMILRHRPGNGMSRRGAAKAFRALSDQGDGRQCTGLGLVRCLWLYQAIGGGHCAIYTKARVRARLVRLYTTTALSDGGTVGCPKSACGGELRCEMILFVETNADVPHSSRRSPCAALLRTVLARDRWRGSPARSASRGEVRRLFTDVARPGGMTCLQLADRREAPSRS